MDTDIPEESVLEAVHHFGDFLSAEELDQLISVHVYEKAEATSANGTTIGATVGKQQFDKDSKEDIKRIPEERSVHFARI